MSHCGADSLTPVRRVLSPLLLGCGETQRLSGA